KEVLNDIYDCQFTDEQIGNEIRYFLDYYGNLRPRIFIGAHRTSYIGKEDKTLRITFDEDMVYRMKDVSLKRSDDDSSINDGIIMEIKVNNSLPLWLVRIMDEAGAYPQAFSKVGKSYLKEKEKEYGII
ncbi:MAG: VTC domain-containing protein, partial [Erysipelotrichaceae bacterium]|nr:VTC domain-containing protein [Erysipelotrichaceae bacterium]